MAQTLAITDNSTYVTFESSATNEQRQHFPKNGIVLRREGDKFSLLNGGDQQVALFRLEYGTDTITVDAVAPASADALETALAGALFV
jgi:hypothetical protein